MEENEERKMKELRSNFFGVGLQMGGRVQIKLQK